jgi:protein-S-isoprenylcysteine O-methyltransferase Ste14
VAQTTVALLSQQAPDKGLQQFLAAKTAGVQAVVNALLLMHTLAVATEAPRLARSAAVLVLAWLLLLALCCWCLLRGRWRA